MTKCLTPAEMADYIDRHSMSLAERQRAHEHIVKCRECLALLAGTFKTVIEISEGR